MRKTLPTVKPLIEALQLADLLVRRQFRVVGAYCLGPSRTDDLGFPDWAQSLPAPTAPRGAGGSPTDQPPLVPGAAISAGSTTLLLA